MMNKTRIRVEICFLIKRYERINCRNQNVYLYQRLSFGSNQGDDYSLELKDQEHGK